LRFINSPDGLTGTLATHYVDFWFDYLAREKDPPPGNMVIWRGLARLADICLGLELSGRVVGN
jgi:hypothetical protein